MPSQIPKYSEQIDATGFDYCSLATVAAVASELSITTTANVNVMSAAVLNVKILFFFHCSNS